MNSRSSRSRWPCRPTTTACNRPAWTAPRFLLRDRDGIYGQDFRDRVEHMGIEEVLIAFRSPWQLPYVQRLIGSIRRGNRSRFYLGCERLPAGDVSIISSF